MFADVFRLDWLGPEFPVFKVFLLSLAALQFPGTRVLWGVLVLPCIAYDQLFPPGMELSLVTGSLKFAVNTQRRSRSLALGNFLVLFLG